jgi:hypothetical protein
MTINDDPNDKLSDHKLQERSVTDNLITIAKVTVCLSSPDHKQCSGIYVDITRKYAIKCLCDCHTKEDLLPRDYLS